VAGFTSIDGPDDPRVQHYRGLTDGERQSRERLGLLDYFIAEGQLVVEKLLASQYQLHSLLMTPARAALMHDLLAQFSGTVLLASTEQMQGIAGFEFHRGVLACGIRPPNAESLTQVRSAPILVVLESVSNPDNVGGIFRTIRGLAGAQAAVLLSHGCADPMYRKCIRVSMGHVFHVPWAVTPDLQNVVASVAARGATIIAATPAETAESCRAMRLEACGQVAVLLGAEGSGLSANMLQTATRRVRIPMAEGVDSLNVGVATALIVDRIVENLNGELSPMSDV
jgi:tRNA G18 (ribose-2'-O)-methylase SpoU